MQMAQVEVEKMRASFLCLVEEDSAPVNLENESSMFNEGISEDI